jgi:hypothetical protein
MAVRKEKFSFDDLTDRVRVLEALRASSERRRNDDKEKYRRIAATAPEPEHEANRVYITTTHIVESLRTDEPLAFKSAPRSSAFLTSSRPTTFS